MIKSYFVTCELDMCAEKIETVHIRANLESKAVKQAVKHFENRGCFHVNVINCHEEEEHED